MFTSKFSRLALSFVVLVSFPIDTVFAACANPTGVAGEMVYNTDYNLMQFCDDTNWISMAGGANVASETDPKVGTLTNGKWCTTDGSVVNCTSDAPASTAGTDTQVIFNDGGVFAGDANYVWDKTNTTLDVTGMVQTDVVKVKPVTGAAAPVGSSVGQWATDGTDVWRATGDVGIGTVSPATKLDVNGKVSATAFGATFTTVTNAITQTSTKSVSVDCPANYTMTGGGCITVCCGGVLIANYPTGNGWACTSTDSYGTAYTTTVYARCMKTN